MTNSKGWLAVLLGVLALGAGWVSLDFKPTTATGAPLAQATATPTATNTPQAPTSTPLILDGPGTMSLGGEVVVGVRATPGAAGTPAIYEPVRTDGSGRLQTSASGASAGSFQPSGAVAAQTPVSVALAGQQVLAQTTVVLPAQTPVAYTIGDVVSASPAVALAFGSVCRINAGSGYVVGARLATDQSTNTASYRLWLYQSAPPTLVADNAANTVLFADNGIRLGYIDIPNLATGTGTSTAAVNQNFDVRVPYTCGAGTQQIVGILEASSAFTPASAQQFYVALRAVPD